MPEYEKTNHHLTICSANYLRLKKLLANFNRQKFKLRNSDAEKKL